MFYVYTRESTRFTNSIYFVKYRNKIVPKHFKIIKMCIDIANSLETSERNKLCMRSKNEKDYKYSKDIRITNNRPLANYINLTISFSFILEFTTLDIKF